MPATLLKYFCALLAATLALSASSQIRPALTPQPLRKASELIRKQERLKINQSVLKDLTPDNARIVVSIPKQRAYLMVGEQLAADGPISSGKRGHSSPTGHMHVLEKDPNHHSSRGRQCANRRRA